jgi:hypothetical protein
MKVTKMKKNTTLVLITLSLVLSVFVLTTCRKAVEEPSPLGPSTFSILLNINANPNVLFAGLTSRQMTSVTATLQKYDGTPLADKTIFFEVVDADGARLDLGYFEGNLALQSKNTDGAGTATVNYYGPLSGEITANGNIYIRGTVSWEGSQFVYETAPVYIIRSAADEFTLNAQAIPEVLYAGATPPQAEIRAQLLAGGAPVQDYPVYFVLQQEVGRFGDGTRSTFALTNTDGIASVTYLGPIYSALPVAPTTVTIRVQVTQTIYEDVTIQIIRFR